MEKDSKIQETFAQLIPKWHHREVLKGQHIQCGGHGSLPSALLVRVQALEGLTGAISHHDVKAEVGKVRLKCASGREINV